MVQESMGSMNSKTNFPRAEVFPTKFGRRSVMGTRERPVSNATGSTLYIVVGLPKTVLDIHTPKRNGRLRQMLASNLL